MRFFLPLTLLFPSLLFGQSVSKQTQQPSFQVEYNAPTVSIRIEGKTMKITEKQESFSNPVSSIPSSTTSVDKEFNLEEEELNDLIRIVKKSRVLFLGEEYGAPEAERHYPHKLRVRLNKKQKEILYRSNPSYPGAPKPYNEVVGALTHLKNRKERGEGKQSETPKGP